jgi:hypothetical protein
MTPAIATQVAGFAVRTLALEGIRLSVIYDRIPYARIRHSSRPLAFRGSRKPVTQQGYLYNESR